MKSISVILLSALFCNCAQTNIKTKIAPADSTQLSKSISSPTGDTCLAQAIAEKILGQPAKLTESSSGNNNNILQHKCTYTAIANDGNKTGNLYYMYEEYKDSTTAQTALDKIFLDNQNMQGMEKKNDIGQACLFHTDKANFAMVIFRKNNKLIRMKINKLTRFTVVEEMMKTARTIATAI